MIERSFLEAHRIAAEKAIRSLADGKPEESSLAERQMGAIREALAATKEIFAKFGVLDIELSPQARVPIPPRPEFMELSYEDLTFSELVKRLRIERGMKQSQLSRKSEIEQYLISRIEKGIKIIANPNKIKSLIAALDLELEDPKAQLLLEKSGTKITS